MTKTMGTKNPLCIHSQTNNGLSVLGRCSPDRRPKAILVFDTAHAAEVKAFDRNICVWYRRFVDQSAYLFGDPDDGDNLARVRQRGRDYVYEIQDLSSVDVLVGMNECVSDVNSAKLANAFHLGFVEACLERGVTPCILNIAAGNVDQETARHLVPCVNACNAAGGFVGYHSYGPADLFEAGEWMLYRFEKIEGWLVVGGMTGKIRWAITEFGYDEFSNLQPSAPWKKCIRKGWLSLTDVQTAYEKAVLELATKGVEYIFLWNWWGYSKDKVQGDSPMSEQMAQEIRKSGDEDYDHAQGVWSDEMKQWYIDFIQSWGSDELWINVEVDVARLRSGPGFNWPVVARVTKNQKYLVKGKVGGWYHLVPLSPIYVHESVVSEV